MRLSSLKYLVKEGFRNLWQNRFMGITSIGVLVSCLLLSGGAYLVFANVDHAFDWAAKQNIVVAWTAEGASDTEIETVETKIKSLANVASTEHLSKEDQLKEYDDKLPTSLNERFQEGENPFVDGFVIHFNDLEQYDETVAQIKQIQGVDDMSTEQNLAAKIIKIRNLVFVIGGGIVGLLLLVSLFIISNTIKLTVYNRRLEISIMKSVGATNAFIRLPFIIEGIVLGAVAAVFAYLVTRFAYITIAKNITLGAFTDLVKFSEVSYILIIGFLAIGILTGMLGSAISISKYLKTEGGIASVI